MSSNIVNDMKIVINAFDPWEISRRVCLQSLVENTTFSNYNNVIIVLGGSTYDMEPTLCPIHDITHLTYDYNIVVIRTTINSIDVNALNMLNIYKHHPLIKTTSMYFHSLDTITFNTDFVERMFNFPFIPELKGCIYSEKPACSAIMIFDHDFIELYNTNFNTPMSKRDAITLEHNMGVVKNVIPYYRFGKHFVVGEKLHLGSANPYNSNDERRVKNYAMYGITKYLKLCSCELGTWQVP